jgi:hypothetical protein
MWTIRTFGRSCRRWPERLKWNLRKEGVVPYLVLATLAGCAPTSSPPSPIPGQTPPAVVSSSTPTPQASPQRVATPEPAEEMQVVLIPEPLLYADGAPIESMEGPTLKLTPFDGYSEAGEFKLGVISDLGPEHARVLIPLLGDAFSGGVIRSTPLGLEFEAKELKSPPPGLKPHGKPVQATRGSLYFDGKRKLLVLTGTQGPGAGWQLVGKAILTQSLVDAVAAKRTVPITRIQGVSI